MRLDNLRAAQGVVSVFPLCQAPRVPLSSSCLRPQPCVMKTLGHTWKNGVAGGQGIFRGRQSSGRVLCAAARGWSQDSSGQALGLLIVLREVGLEGLL